ncbi:hypothetical protein FB567DRAFT_526809 [Paraphoma chrysanthemicola]|uniref:Uncharacterized protein n=1 Tax=Paraphoma chrysanthemicola TaxID=798071 RepID=A0A8K0VZ28_9PLEO|nr:hypothetical protein FB567DRAFT_526809 [Paraphoma chrysanthemicola]
MSPPFPASTKHTSSSPPTTAPPSSRAARITYTPLRPPAKRILFPTTDANSATTMLNALASPLLRLPPELRAMVLQEACTHAKDNVIELRISSRNQGHNSKPTTPPRGGIIWNHESFETDVHRDRICTRANAAAYNPCSIAVRSAYLSHAPYAFTARRGEGAGDYVGECGVCALREKESGRDQVCGRMCADVAWFGEDRACWEWE